MCARTKALGQNDTTHRTSREILGINQDAFGPVILDICDERNEIAVIFVFGIDTGCKRAFAAIAAGTEVDFLTSTRF